VADLVGTEAGRLLVDRARAVDPGFAVSEADAADAALLCRRLDGLPLAIELAAARLGSLGPRDLLERLDARFGLLTAGSRTAMSRQQTLAATLDWSHDLLAEPQRAVLRRLSVFAGGFELTAAEAVAAMPPVTASEMAGLVADLVDKSLVGVESVDGRRRHRLLETIREYGRGRLAEAGELETTARRHAQWCLELAEQAEPMLSTHEEPLWLRRLEAELDNLRAALRWSLDREPELYGRLAAALGLFWLRRLRISEAIGWLDAAAERVSAPTLLRVRVLCARTAIDVRRLGHTNDWSAVAEAAEIAHSAGDALMEGRCLLILGSYQLLVGLDKGYTAFDRAREHGLRSGLPQIAVSADACRAVTHGLRGDDDDAEAAILETLEQVRRLADSALVPGMVNAGEVVGPRPELGGRVRSILEETMMPFRDLPAREAEAHVVAVRGVLARMRGDMELAELLLTEALEMSRRLGDTRGVADNLARGGQLALVVGDLSRARTRLRAALHLRRGLGDARLEGLTVSALGTLALAAGDHARASRLHDMALTRFRRAGDRPGMGNALMRRGDLALVAGDLDAAEADYRNVTVNTARYEAWTTFCLAEVAEARGHADQARALLLAVRDQLERGYGRRARAACDARLAALEVRISGA
jgi:tetratricopeptide (TPR) repeat protein